MGFHSSQESYLNARFIRTGEDDIEIKLQNDIQGGTFFGDGYHSDKELNQIIYDPM